MLQRLWVAAMAVLLLGGCGRGDEDFTVRVARPPERVMQELGHAGLDGEVSGHFPGLKVERSDPATNEVLYTIPGDSNFPAAIHLTFEAVDGGKETVVHAAVDVPASEGLAQRPIKGHQRIQGQDRAAPTGREGR